jgi:hypothetical protein
MQRGNEGNSTALNLVKHGMPTPRSMDAFDRRLAGVLRQIKPCTKVIAMPMDNADARVGLGAPNRNLQGLDRRIVECIALSRTIETDQSDVIAQLEREQVVF